MATEVKAPSTVRTENKPGGGVRILLGTASVHATGCNDASQSFVTAIPKPDLLDRSYKGVLAGIEVAVTEANNGHEYKNFNFINDGNAITYQLYAKGAGNYVHGPFGGVCVGAAGGSMGVEIWGHYTRQP